MTGILFFVLALVGLELYMSQPYIYMYQPLPLITMTVYQGLGCVGRIFKVELPVRDILKKYQIIS